MTDAVTADIPREGSAGGFSDAEAESGDPCCTHDNCRGPRDGHEDQARGLRGTAEAKRVAGVPAAGTGCYQCDTEEQPAEQGGYSPDK